MSSSEAAIVLRTSVQNWNVLSSVDVDILYHMAHILCLRDEYTLLACGDTLRGAYLLGGMICGQSTISLALRDTELHTFLNMAGGHLTGMDGAHAFEVKARKVKPDCIYVYPKDGKGCGQGNYRSPHLEIVLMAFSDGRWTRAQPLGDDNFFSDEDFQRPYMYKFGPFKKRGPQDALAYLLREFGPSWRTLAYMIFDHMLMKFMSPSQWVRRLEDTETAMMPSGDYQTVSMRGASPPPPVAKLYDTKEFSKVARVEGVLVNYHLHRWVQW